jgi:hypothetical protein
LNKNHLMFYIQVVSLSYQKNFFDSLVLSKLH